jgi:hypothetical protein
MTRLRLILHCLPARSVGYTRCPLCGRFQGPALAGYAITQPGGSVDSVPVCDSCAMKHSPALIPARDAANGAVAEDADRVRWKIARGEAERVPEGTPMTIGERLNALEWVERNLCDRQVALVYDCPTDQSQLDEEIRCALRAANVSPEELCGVAYIRPEDTHAIGRGEEFGISATLPHGDGCRDAERRVRAVADVVHQELLKAGIPHTWDGGKVLWVDTRRAGGRESQGAGCESMVM